MKKEIVINDTIIAVLILIVVFVSFFYYYTEHASSQISGAATSQVGNLSANIQTYISCTWSSPALNVSFGATLNPGDTNVNATRNYNETHNATSYNVSVDALSNVQANITLQGADLMSGASVFGVSNISWQSNTTLNNGTDMNGTANTTSWVLRYSYDLVNKVAVAEPIGSVVFYRFWMDVPSAQVAGVYTGNYTMQCTQAT